MPPKKKKETKRISDFVDLEIDKNILVKVLKATKDVIMTKTNVAIRFYKNGIYFCQLDSEHVAVCGIALSTRGDYIENYKTIDGHELFASQERTLGEMLSFIAATGGKEKTVRIRVNQTHIKLNVGRASRKLKILEWTDELRTDIFNSIKAMHNNTKNYERLITVKSDEFAHAVKNFAKLDGIKDHFDLGCDKEHFILFRELDDNDNIEVDLVTMKKGKMKKQEYKAKFPVDYLAAAVPSLAPLTEELTITGESDCPVLLSAGKAPVPEDKPQFNQDFDFWYVLAPRIIEE